MLPFQDLPTIYLALGSNLGDRHAFLQKAREALAAVLTDINESSIYETAPQYVTDQPSFLNQVISGKTTLTAQTLLKTLQQIQKEVGRNEPNIRFGPREIDIDILSYGDLIIKEEHLEIPHPRLSERLFVLEPLSEIAPDWICPKSKESVKVMLTRLKKEQTHAG